MMHRSKDRIELYIERSLKPKKKRYSVLSRYYQINGFIIRVSDHLSENTQSQFQILVNRNNNDYYVVYFKKRKDPSVLTYKELQCALKIWKMFPQIYDTIPTSKNMDVTRVLGVPISYFDADIRRKIAGYARKVRKQKYYQNEKTV